MNVRPDPENVGVVWFCKVDVFKYEFLQGTQLDRDYSRTLFSIA